MQPFCSVEQYTARFGDVANVAQLQECLLSATALMREHMDAAHVAYDEPTESFAFTLMDVCRGVANRLMPTDGGEGIPQGVTSYQQTAGPYSGTYTFASSFATPRLTRQEFRRLGIGLITTIDLTAGAQ